MFSTISIGMFVKEADGSRILEEFRINSAAFWFLQSEFLKQTAAAREVNPAAGCFTDKNSV